MGLTFVNQPFSFKSKNPLAFKTTRNLFSVVNGSIQRRTSVSRRWNSDHSLTYAATALSSVELLHPGGAVQETFQHRSARHSPIELQESFYDKLQCTAHSLRRSTDIYRAIYNWHCDFPLSYGQANVILLAELVLVSQHANRKHLYVVRRIRQRFTILSANACTDIVCSDEHSSRKVTLCQSAHEVVKLVR